MYVICPASLMEISLKYSTPIPDIQWVKNLTEQKRAINTAL